MTSRRWGRLFFVVGILTLSLLIAARFSFVQPEQPTSLPDLQSVPPQANLSHPACLTCFTYACPDCYTIMEEILGTGLTIARQIPNPAPLEPDEQRLEFDPETGLPIWYIGRQPYVGPTDEQPYSAEYPVPLIQLKRIHARVQDKVFSIPGIHAFGIGSKGFVVYLDPEYLENESLIPQQLEGVPVEVEMGGPIELISHETTRFRPVPTGVGVSGVLAGTAGPHIVRTGPFIHTLTAGHVLKFLDAPVSSGSPVYQPRSDSPAAQQWGTLIHGFQNTPCDTPSDPNCNLPSAPVNLTWQRPDVAAIAHISSTHTDTYPHRALTDPEDTNNGTSPSRSPIRRLQYGGGTTYVNGPSGIIQTVSAGTAAKMWGGVSCCPHAPAGTIGPLVTFTATAPSQAGGTRKFKFQFLCIVDLDRNVQEGDSGSLVSGSGTGNRHVFGVAMARDAARCTRVYFTLAGDIETAFDNSNFSFTHYWGTASGRSDLWFPLDQQCDGSC